MTANEMTDQEVHALLAGFGIRVFALSLDSRYSHGEYKLFIHPHKTTAEWREDVRTFLKGVGAGWGGTSDVTDAADDNIFHAFYGYLRNLGYHEMEDVVSDVYEGRLTCEMSRIVDDPDHEEQTDGFGHFGWENRQASLHESDSGL